MVIGINSGETDDPMEAAARFQAQHRLTYPILVDPNDAAQTAFGVRAFPTHVIIDRAGTIRYAGAGFDRAAINQTLTALTRAPS